MTRKLVLLSIICFFTVSAVMAQLKLPATVKWYTIDQAMELQKKEPRKIMIDVYTDWCGWCKKMDSETFNNPVIAEYLNANFYPVKFNAESKAPVTFGGKTFVNENQGSRSSHQFAIALLQGQMSYPSIAYLGEKLEPLGAVPGYYSAKDFEPLIKFIKDDKYKTTTFEDFKKTFVGSVK
jgi:thioredoxin-related protein